MRRISKPIFHAQPWLVQKRLQTAALQSLARLHKLSWRPACPALPPASKRGEKSRLDVLPVPQPFIMGGEFGPHLVGGFFQIG